MLFSFGRKTSQKSYQTSKLIKHQKLSKIMLSNVVKQQLHGQTAATDALPGS
jgi:hypothetical protein